MLIRDELNGWLKDMERPVSGNSDVEFWLSAYDGAYSAEIFADESKSRVVKRGKVSICGGIQPKVFQEHLEADTGNGFNSRPLYVFIPRVKRRLLDHDPQTLQLKQTLGDLYYEALTMCHECEPVTYKLTPDATKLFDDWFEKLDDLSMEAGSDEVEALWAKAPGQVLRTAGAVQFLLDYTGQGEAAGRSFSGSTVIKPVGCKAVQLAAKLVMVGSYWGSLS